jgi:hypothetical protein
MLGNGCMLDKVFTDVKISRIFCFRINIQISRYTGLSFQDADWLLNVAEFLLTGLAPYDSGKQIINWVIISTYVWLRFV